MQHLNSPPYITDSLSGLHDKLSQCDRLLAWHLTGHKEDDPLAHPIYREYGVLRQEVASQLSQARAEGRRIICVGTTTVRFIEQMAQNSNATLLEPFEGWVSLFILPGYQFRVVDALITNLHLSKATLLMETL